MQNQVAFLFLMVFVTSRSQEIEAQKPRLGKTVNIFSRYGYLSISMRVVPRNDSETWIFREPTLDVFHNPVTELQSSTQNTAAFFEGDFHMEFCDNLRQLLQAYFRNFIFERFEKPWRAFTNSWSKSTIAKHLGINGSFITGSYSYVFIRISRFRDNKTFTQLSDELIVDKTMKVEANNVTIGDAPSVIRFIRNFGSHYVRSFITGNSLYQVFVYSPRIYQRVKERLKAGGVTELSTDELKNYFSPWYAEYVGVIRSTSGNQSVEAWAVEHLRLQHTFVSYPTLLKLHGESMLLRQLEQMLGNEALLQLHLQTLAPIFDDFHRRKWFLEVLDNYSQLWEVNM